MIRAQPLFPTPDIQDQFSRYFARNSEKIAKPHLAPKLTPASETPADQDAVLISFSAERIVTEYMQFLASVRSNEEGTDYQEEYESLTEQAGFNTVPAEGEITAAQLEAEFSQEIQAALSIDGESLYFRGSVEIGLDASLSGTFQTTDGRTVSFETQASLRVAVEIELSITGAQLPAPPTTDPLALDVDGNGSLSLTDAANGAMFDVNADGVVDKTSFITGNDVFLAYDRNANGLIDDGQELFGDQHGAANGFLELKKFDDDGNNVIDDKDSIFHRLVGLRLGPNGTFEQTSLSALGISSIVLNYFNINQAVTGGNTLSQISAYQRPDGSSGAAYDVLLTRTA